METLQYQKFIGAKFWVKGLNEPRTVIIESVYFWDADKRKRFPVFKCRVVGNYSHFKDGDRENFLCREVVKNGNLVDTIKVLTA